MISFIREILRKSGYDLVGWNAYNGAFRRKKLYSTVDHLIDVGANTGQFALGMRKLGYTGNISSFEPLDFAFKECSRHAAKDPLWQAFNYALGAEAGEAEINVADNGQSSSLLTKAEQESGFSFVGKNRIEVKPLDSVFDDVILSSRPRSVGLKIDTQGYEKQVLEGASQSLARIDLVQLECPFARHSYEGVWQASELLSYMNDRGFVPASFEPGYLDEKSGRLYEVDIIFVRENA